MNDFIHNAGHELKTPLSVIDSNIQLIDDMKVYDKEMTLELKKEVIRLNSLIDSLVKLSDIDVFKKTEDVNLKNTINDIINDFKFKISESNIDIKVSITKSITVKANKDYLYIFLSNII
jgi:signal transduction histidine kinase